MPPLGRDFFSSTIVPVRPEFAREIESRGTIHNAGDDPGVFLSRLRNQLRPYAPVPVVFGKHRVVPPLVARSTTDASGDVTNIEMTVCWGYGPLRITGLEIGGVPLSTFEDVTETTVEGRSANASPITFPEPLALTTLEIRATDQLLDYIDTLSGVVEAEGPMWDGSSWSDGYSRNPATAFRLALQGPARKNPVADDDLDLDALADFYEFCDDNGYHFDHWHARRQGVRSLLNDICAVARASPVWRRGKWSVVIDDDSGSISEHYTALNVADFTAQRSYRAPTHALRISFNNEDRDWRRDERVVYEGSHDADSATEISTLHVKGITDPAHVWKYGRYQLARAEAERGLVVRRRRGVPEREARGAYLDPA